MSDTIKPPWAFSIWSNSDHIFVELPAIDGHQAHQVRLPNDVVSLKKILVLAKARDIKSKIGMKGDPTQAQIEKLSYDPSMVRKVRPKLKFTAEQRIGARDILRRMGLI
jgi:hypothetical protein